MHKAHNGMGDFFQHRQTYRGERKLRYGNPGGVRAVLECAGVRDVLTKSLGSSNRLNVVRATWEGLKAMSDVEAEAKRRNKPAQQFLPPWRKTQDVKSK